MKSFISSPNFDLNFEPENAEDLAKQVRDFAQNPEKIKEMGVNARNYVSTHFNRNLIAQTFYYQLNELLAKNEGKVH